MNQLTGGHHPVGPRTIQGPVRVSIRNKEATDTIVGRKKAPVACAQPWLPGALQKWMTPFHHGASGPWMTPVAVCCQWTCNSLWSC